MTRQEHLDWAKERALEYLKTGDINTAWISIVSDLGKHPETKNHTGIMLGMMMLMSGNLSTPQKMREFIQGFN